MSEPELREKLSEAGWKHDGHVTNGSLAAQMRVIDGLLTREDAYNEAIKEAYTLYSTTTDNAVKFACAAIANNLRAARDKVQS